MTYFKVYTKDIDGDIKIIKTWLTETEAQNLASYTFNGMYTEQSDRL